MFFYATAGAVVYGALFPSTVVYKDPDEEALFCLAAALLASNLQGDAVD
jgi:hypothetical protein